MKRHAIILYWLLLLVPTLIIAGAAFKLLWHEQERLHQQARSAAMDRAKAIADTLQINVITIEDDLMAALRKIPRDKLLKTLLAWEDKDPLVRNVFIWRSRVGLEYPKPGETATEEKEQFIARFSSLFSRRNAWSSGLEGVDKSEIPIRGPVRGPEARPSQLPVPVQRAPQQQYAQQQSNLVRDIQLLRQNRAQVQEQVDRQITSSKRKAGSQKAPKQPNGGWVPWFSGNRLCILGWLEWGSSGPVYGVELELMTLLSRLVADFPKALPKGPAYALVDGGGRILHQTGRADLRSNPKPDLSIPLAPQLPHWQVAAYFTEGGSSANAGLGFFILSGLLLATFVVAIIVGGSLLTWQAHRNMQDALQKTSFVSNVSHELKTPLTSILMYADLLREGRIQDPAKKERYLEVIVEESQRLTRLVNNVLDFGRLEQGRVKFNVEDVNVNEFLKDFEESIRLRVERTGMKLETYVPENTLTVSTDRNALEQALLNITDNAIKYASDGGELTFDLDIHTDHCEIHVLDRGSGVPKEHRDRIFEKFHRVDDSLTTRHPGSGLGLSITRGLLRGLGGDLLYSNREGGGSVFTAVLPSAGPASASYSADKKEEPQQ